MNIDKLGKNADWTRVRDGLIERDLNWKTTRDVEKWLRTMFISVIAFHRMPLYRENVERYPFLKDAKDPEDRLFHGVDAEGNAFTVPITD